MTRLRGILFLHYVYTMIAYYRVTQSGKCLGTVCILFRLFKRIKMSAQERLCRTDARARTHYSGTLRATNSFENSDESFNAPWTSRLVGPHDPYWISSLACHVTVGALDSLDLLTRSVSKGMGKYPT